MEFDLSFAEKELLQNGINISKKDLNRPWGGFLVIIESDIQKFLSLYFKEFNLNELASGFLLSPKILFVAPNQRLSWQYHKRRKEIWKVIKGPVAVSQSKTDSSQQPIIWDSGSLIRVEQEERHRLIGLNNWAVIAEVWVHTDISNPSNENDIIRVQDDFGR